MAQIASPIDDPLAYPVTRNPYRSNEMRSLIAEHRSSVTDSPAVWTAKMRARLANRKAAPVH